MPPKHMALLDRLCEPGPSQERLSLPRSTTSDPGATSLRTPLSGTLTLPSLILAQQTQMSETRISMPECRAPSRNSTLVDRLNSFNSTTQTTRSSQTLQVVSILRGPGLTRFWNESVKVLSNNLSSCKGTDFADSPLTSLKQSADSIAQKSWFSNQELKNPNFQSLLRTSSPSTPYSFVVCKANGPDCTDVNDPSLESLDQIKKKLMRSLKLRLLPSKVEKLRWKTWLGWCRIAYNLVIADYNRSKRVKPLKTYRELVLDNRYAEHGKLRSLKLISEDIEIGIHWNTLDESIREAIKNLKKGVFQDNVKMFKFKTRKDYTQTITIREGNILKPKSLARFNDANAKHSRIFFGEGSGLGLVEPRKKNNSWPNTEGRVDHDSKIVFDTRTKKFHFAWIYELPSEEGLENQETSKTFSRVVSIDPGISPFMAWYSPTAGAGRIGKGDYSRLVRMLMYVDKMQSRMVNAKGRTKYRLRLAKNKLQQNVKNLVSEIHNKTIQFLLEKFDLIILPWFHSKNMSKRLGRKLSNQGVRSMLTWSHYGFREKLKSKCEVTPGKKLVVLESEAYTSKTCTECGTEDNYLRLQKVFSCRSCNAGASDRDVHAAKNMLLRAYSKGYIEVL